MRGSPPLQLALLLLSFMGLAIPLVQLTSARDTVAAPVATVAVEGKALPVTLRLRFAHQPTKLTLELNGKPLLADADVTQSPIEVTTDLSIPKDGIDLQLKAEWPTGTPDTAVTLDIEPDGLDSQSQTRWSVGPNLEEVIPFLWKL